MGNLLLISVLILLTNYFKETGNVNGTTISSMLSYDLRPICLFFFLMMTGKVSVKSKWFPLAYVPLIVNALVYLMMLFPATREYIVYYELNDSGTVSFFGSDIFVLRYFSHIVSGLYLVYLLYFSITKVSSKRIGHGLTLLACALFVVLAVVIESEFNEKGDIEILNDTIAVAALVYYLYLYIERTQIDGLTGLFNRETYYNDLQKMKNNVTGVIQFDMNGLKYLNDNFGHLEGDKALATIADVVSRSAKRNMYVYRLGGDEYILLCLNGSEQDILDVVASFKENLKKTDYYCSYGYSYRSNKNDLSVDDMIKEAERKMYEDKERFYKNSPFERRKSGEGK